MGFLFLRRHLRAVESLHWRTESSGRWARWLRATDMISSVGPNTRNLLGAMALMEKRQIQEQQSWIEEQQMILRLRGGSQTFDFDADSLQKRLLTFFRGDLNYSEGESDLIQADAHRRDVWGKMERAHLLGFTSANKELCKPVEEFSDRDLLLLNRAIVAERSSEEMKSHSFSELFLRKCRDGRGEDLVRYLAARLELKTEHEPFNANLMVAANLWTNPRCPMWMMPGAGAVQIIEKITEQPISPSAYNGMIQAHGLTRVPLPIVTAFFSVKNRSALGVSLRAQLSDVMGIPCEQVQRGGRVSRRNEIAMKGKRRSACR